MQRGKDYIGVGVGAAIVNEESKILLAKRGKKVINESGLWETPGGKIEFGDTQVETLIREMNEEFGIEIEVLELTNVCDHILPNEGQHWLAPQYLAKHIKGEPKILEPEKCEEIGWYTIDEALNMNLTIPARVGLEAIKKKYPHKLPKF